MRIFTIIPLSLSLLSFTALAADKVPEAMKIPVNSQTTPKETTEKHVQESPQGDSTVRNKVHDGNNAVTADEQSSDKADVEITRKIRQEVMKDNSLSTYAHNVKIITAQRRVVLKGPVRNNEEKMKIETLAKAVAGQDHVVSEIEVTR